MPIHASSVGLKLDPITVPMTRRKLLSFAASINDTSEKVFDDLNTEFCAVPQICVALEWASIIKNDLRGKLGASREEVARAVHTIQDTVFHRPVHAGESLTVGGKIIAAWNGRSGTKMVTKITSLDELAEPVFSSHLQSTYRDVELSGTESKPQGIPTMPPEPPETSQTSQRTIDIPLTLPHTFSECADIWNPIHTERTVASSVGLPNVILHGVATWALAGREILAEFADRDVTRLKRLRGRMAAMVIPGKPLTINMRTSKEEKTKKIWYGINTSDGAPAIREGYAEIE